MTTLTIGIESMLIGHGIRRRRRESVHPALKKWADAIFSSAEFQPGETKSFTLDRKIGGQIGLSSFTVTINEHGAVFHTSRKKPLVIASKRKQPA